MKDMVSNYSDMILEKYSIYEPTVIAYGSNCYGENKSDLDVCVLVNQSFDKESNMIEDTVQFSIENGIKIDEEIPYNNKLIFTYKEVDEILKDSPFINNDGKYEIKDIVKTSEFLSSYEMHQRLLLNIFTTENNILCGKRSFVEYCEKRAWKIILEAIYHTYGLDFNVDENELLSLLYQNPVTHNDGEMYLGYKTNNERKMRYLKRQLLLNNKKYINDIINLSENVNPYFPSLCMRTELKDNSDILLDYPENKDIKLRKIIGEFFKLNENYILFTNGAMEAIHILVEHFVDEIACLITPTFWGIADRLRKLNKPFIEIESNQDNLLDNLEECCSNYKYVFMCNPNNPTLTEMGMDDVEYILKKYPKCTLIIDETLMSFRKNVKEKSFINLLRKYNNLVVFMSLSKISGVCGIRGGFVAMNPYHLFKLLTNRALYNTNSLAQRFFEKHFVEIMDCNEEKECISNNFKEFEMKLDKKSIVEILNKETSFVLVRFKDDINVKHLKLYLDKKNVKVMWILNSYPEFKGNWMRISAGRRSDLLNLANLINHYSNGEARI